MVYGALFLVFRWNSILLSIVVALIYIPTKDVKVLLFSTFSPASVVLNSYFDWGEVISVSF
jgi:Gpi18-like mannosyltransferase